LIVATRRKVGVVAASATTTSFLCSQSFSDILSVMGKSRVSVKCKLYNLGLVLKDTTHLQNQAVSSVSSSAKTPIIRHIGWSRGFC
jgi:hypothetical protein